MTADAPQDGTLALIRGRTTALLFVFVLWGVVVTVRLAQCMIFQRSRILPGLMASAVSRGVIPARRGRLLDRDGRTLAWSTRQFFLSWRIPAGKKDAARAWHKLAEWREYFDAGWSQTVILTRTGTVCELARNLDPKAVISLKKAENTVDGLRVRSRFVRHRHPAPRIRRILGRVVVRDGMEIGVSGAEKDHDALLSGVPGQYTIMVDRHGNWLPETWRSLRDVRPGYDVSLPIRAPAGEEGGP